MARPKSKATVEMSQHPWDQFESLKEQSYLYIDQALLLEKTDTPSRALVMYQKGLDCLDTALNLPVELPGSTSDTLKKIRKSRAKMSRTRQQIVFRIQELSPNQSNNSNTKEISKPGEKVQTQCDTNYSHRPSAPLRCLHVPSR